MRTLIGAMEGGRDNTYHGRKYGTIIINFTPDRNAKPFSPHG
jgi:hypothetical protein